MEKLKQNDSAKFRLLEGTKVQGIIELFEEYNPIIQSISDIKRCVNKIIVFLIINPIIIICIQRINYLGSIVLSILTGPIIVGFIYKKARDISYIHSKNIGGKRNKNIFRISQTITYNLQLMRKEEWKLINKILEINNLNNVNYIKELREYYSKNKLSEKYNIKNFVLNFLGVLVIPTIGIAISIFLDIEGGEKFLFIFWTIIGTVFLSMVSIIVYYIYKTKKLSITNIYIVPTLERLLTEMLLSKRYYNTSKIRVR